MQPHELLGQVSLLSGLDEDSRKVLAGQMQSVEVPAHTKVIAPGDAGDVVFLIRTGTVEVLIHDADGTPTLLATLGPGEYFGEMALLDDHPRSATIVTTAPCVFLTLSRAAFHDLVVRQPTVALALLRELSARLRACHRRVADLAVVDAYARVGRFLLDHAVREGGREVLPASWTVSAMAAETELSEAMAGQVLRELEREGYVETTAGRVFILKQLVRPHELVGFLIW
jgi:CRP/FNR family cyclic AMP-dependent transcriptional regulator